PHFVLRALTALVGSHPTHVAWRQSLGRWLQLWPLANLGPEGATLATAAGLTLPVEETAIPPGVDPGAWLLHQASRAVRRDAPAEALALLRRAAEAGPLPPIAEAAIPALQRLADAGTLAVLPGASTHPAVLAGLVEELRRLPDGEAVLAAARASDGEACLRLLDERLEREGLTPRLHHHLALLATRAARHQERAE